MGTKCDLIINPTGAETNGECDTQPPATEWYNEVGGARGILAGLTAGYAARRVRLEAEYLYRSAAYNARAPTVIGDEVTLDKAEQELEVADGGVDDVTGHHWFANVYYHIAPGSRLRPHIGVGTGWARMSLDYFSRWKRNDDPDAITTFVDPVLKAKIAGTTTIGEGRLTDSMFGYQLLAGADVAVTDEVALAVKVRRAGLRRVRERGPRVAAAAKPRFHGRSRPPRGLLGVDRRHLVLDGVLQHEVRVVVGCRPPECGLSAESRG